jgi:hypothetical protein
MCNSNRTNLLQLLNGKITHEIHTISAYPAVEHFTDQGAIIFVRNIFQPIGRR